MYVTGRKKINLPPKFQNMSFFSLLTLFIRIDTISMELSIFYFKGSQVEISIECDVSWSLKNVFA